MRSPFPGMDPYLEAHWPAVHAILIAETWRALNRSLPADLSASVEERVAVESDEQITHASPDVFVYEPASSDWNLRGGDAVVIDAPFKMVVDIEPSTERSVRVISRRGQLVTVIEFFSPANKRKPGAEAYLSKRSELLDAGVHIVEVDLVRAGNWVDLFLPHVCTEKAMSLYRVTVRIASTRRSAYVYPIHLNHTLPNIQIPLRSDDPRVYLALQPMIEAIYVDGRYSQTLDYNRTLDPPLPNDDQAFSTEMISAAR